MINVPTKFEVSIMALVTLDITGNYVNGKRGNYCKHWQIFEGLIDCVCCVRGNRIWTWNWGSGDADVQ